MLSSINFAAAGLISLQLIGNANAASIPHSKRTFGTNTVQSVSNTYWNYNTCYWDPGNDVMSYSFTSTAMTVDLCTSTCQGKGYTLAGLEWGNICWCGNSLNQNYYSIDKRNCQFNACTGNKAIGCGGDTAVAVYKYDTGAVASASASASAASASAASASAASASAASASAASASAASASAASASAASASASAASASAASASAASASAASASAASASAASASASRASASAASASAASASAAAASASAASASAASASAASASAASASAASASAASASAASASAASASAASASKAAASASAASASAASASAASASAASASAASASAASASAASASAASASAASASAASASAASASAASASAASASAASASAAAAAALATSIPTPWVRASVPCIAEGTSGRALTGASTAGPSMTFNQCLTYCGNQGFAIAGLEFSGECYCGNYLTNGASTTKTSNDCNMACSGSPSTICGGPNALNLFVLPSKIAGLASDLTPAAAKLPSGWSAASTSCIQEGSTGRALTGASTAGGSMTIASCLTYCTGQGFGYAGLEYGGECYCGSGLVNGASLNIASNQCNMACTGDASSNCGGPSALNLFVNPSITPKGPTAPVAASLPSGWSAASTTCIQEVSGRALTGASTAGNTMTVPSCLNFCQSKGFQYAGLEYSGECYCGASLVNGASLSLTSGQCNMQCAGDASTTCGGPNAIQLYVNPANAVVVPAAPVVNGFTGKGCIQEVAGRALTGKRVDDPNMTIEMCTAACSAAGFKMAGVEYGVECYCGNTLDNGSNPPQASGQCVMPCPGNASQMCGGPNAIQLYSL